MFWKPVGDGTYQPTLPANDPMAPESEIFPYNFNVGSRETIKFLLNIEQIIEECKDNPVVCCIYEPFTYPRVYVTKTPRGGSSETSLWWETSSADAWGNNLNRNNQLYNAALVCYTDNYQITVNAYGSGGTCTLNALYGYKN